MRKVFYLLVAICFLAGCATTVTNLKPSATKIAADKALVIGEVEFEGFQTAYRQIMVGVKNSQTGKVYTIKVDESNIFAKMFPEFGMMFSDKKKDSLMFFAELPKGEYSISSLNFGTWQMYWPGIYFSVPEAGNVISIGKVRLVHTGAKNIWMGTVKTRIELVNNADELAGSFQRKYPGFNKNVVSGPMIFRWLTYELELVDEREAGEYCVSAVKQFNEAKYYNVILTEEVVASMAVDIKENGRVSNARFLDSVSSEGLTKQSIITVLKKEKFPISNSSQTCEMVASTILHEGVTRGLEDKEEPSAP